MKRRLLRDPLTNICASLTALTHPDIVLRVSLADDSSTFLNRNYPELLTAPDYTELPLTQVNHEIDTHGPPLFCKPRPLSLPKLEAAKKEFDSLLKLNIIRPSCSPWASPLHLVRKADGSWRPCGDYRRLNTITIPDRYPVPNLQTFHQQMAGMTIFTKLDLVKAYHFIPVQEKDIEKTAICTPFGSFEYLRMPFGLRNSAGTFQRFIDNQLRDIPNAVAYIDDILIFSKSAEEHEEHLATVLTRLKTIGLRLNGAKCETAKPSMQFLGYHIDQYGIKPPESRITALRELPIPKDAKEVQRYLGMFGFYQRCIPKYADITLPLRDLIKADEFIWTREHGDAFTILKDAVANATQLNFPTSDGKLTITADASAYAIGACLNQMTDGEAKPLSFFSRKLSETEQNYSKFYRELLAVFGAVKKWKDIIDGNQVTVFTDHKPIVGAFHSDKPRLSDKQQRQLSFIGEYVLDVVHISGKDNVVADTLSRSVSSITEEPRRTTDLSAIAKAQNTNPDAYQDYKKHDIGIPSKPLFCKVSQPNPRPVVPPELRPDVFHALHDLCHPGIKATIRLLNTRYYWENMRNDIKKWCSECLDCQKAKVTRHTKKAIKDIPYPTQRFSMVHMDIVGPLEPEEDSNPRKARYLLTVIDAHTRWLEAIPMVNISSETVCNAFLLNWVARFGPPLHLTTDRGTQFTSEVAKKLTELLGIHHIRTTAHNPRANGMVERSHRTLKASLKARGRNWLHQLPIVLLGLRMRPDEDGTSAFSRVTGEQPMVPQILPGNFDLTQLSVELHRLPFSHNPPRRREIKVNVPEALQWNTHAWLRIDRVKKPLEAPYQGTFEILRRTDDTFTLKIRGKPVVVSVDRFKPAILSQPTSQQQQETAEPEPPDITSPEDPPLADRQHRTRSGRQVRFQQEDDYEYF